jgi:hypothetical protein
MSLSINSDFNGVTDPDAGRYIAAVEAADGQLLEFAVGKAMNNFIVGCKADGTWDAIKASCILSGARTLTGALVPLAGTAPTNTGFTSGDYNRKTGLVGSSGKSLDSNRLGTAEPQNSKHAGVYATSAATSGAGNFPIYIGQTSLPATIIYREPSNGGLGFRCGTTTPDGFAAGGATGLIAVNRSLSTSFTLRASQTTQTFTRTSEAVAGTNFLLFVNSNARLAFYSIGESLDLALLDTRVTTMINAFAAAIP